MNSTEILGRGPFLGSNKHWNKIGKIMDVKGLPGFIYKLEIGGHDIYVQTGWWHGEIVWIDITLSRGGQSTIDCESGLDIDVAQFDMARYVLDEACKRASELLQSRTVGIGHFVRDWRGREMYPTGYCPQLESIVRGPKDAVARLIESKIVEWTTRIKMMEDLKNARVADQ